MSDINHFAKMMPGFDFLQSLMSHPLASAPGGASKSAAGIPPMPNPVNWLVPTLSTEELDKRIEELKAVQFWLDQNARALQATVTALEVQKMTLNTLKGMNIHMSDVANAFTSKTADTAASPHPADPMQWWGSLTQQFGDIAQSVMKDAVRQTGLDATQDRAKAATGKTTARATRSKPSASKAPASKRVKPAKR